MADHGVRVGVHRIKRIRGELGLRCKQKRKFKATTDSRHNLPVAPNLLGRKYAVAAPNKAWVTDMTYVATDEGWLYLAGLKDLFDGELVGYAMAERMTKQLVMKALFRAVVARRPGAGLIHHSDRGSQLTPLPGAAAHGPAPDPVVGPSSNPSRRSACTTDRDEVGPEQWIDRQRFSCKLLGLWLNVR